MMVAWIREAAMGIESSEFNLIRVCWWIKGRDNGEKVEIRNYSRFLCKQISEHGIIYKKIRSNRFWDKGVKSASESEMCEVWSAVRQPSEKSTSEARYTKRGRLRCRYYYRVIYPIYSKNKLIRLSTLL